MNQKQRELLFYLCFETEDLPQVVLESFKGPQPLKNFQTTTTL